MTTKVIVRKGKDGEPRENANGEVTVYIRYQHKGKVSDFQACKVKPIDLVLVEVKDKVEVIEPYIRPRAKGRLEAANSIETIKQAVKSAMNRLIEKSIEPLPKLVRKEFEERFDQCQQVQSKHKLLDIFKDYIQSQINSGLANSTIKQYRSTFLHLSNFHSAYGYEYSIEEVDMNYYDDFIYFLRNKQHGIKKDSTIGKYVKTLKSALRWAKSRGYIIHADVETKNFKVFESEKKVFYLTEPEVELLMKLDLRDSLRLCRVRDRFVFNCYVGLRVGDLSSLSSKQIKSVKLESQEFKVVELITQKQKKRTIVPLKSIPLDILKKYDYSLPKISDQKNNQYLKELLRRAGIVRDVEISPGIFQPLYELATSHLAVKTFITLCHKWGIPTRHVSEITGKTEKVINQYYYAVSDEDLIKIMLNS